MKYAKINAIIDNGRYLGLRSSAASTGTLSVTCVFNNLFEGQTVPVCLVHGGACAKETRQTHLLPRS